MAKQKQTKTTQFNQDGWMNSLTNLGVKGKDKGSSYVTSYIGLKQKEADELYAADDMARKIVEDPAKSATREGIDFLNLEQEQEDALNKSLKDLNSMAKVREAYKLARVYGGASLYIDFEGGGDELDKQVELNSIQSIRALIPFDMYELQANSTTLISDFTSPDYCLPETYQLNQRCGGAAIDTIHHSRIIRFDGDFLTRDQLIQNNYWHASVLDKSFKAIQNFNQSHNTVSAMMVDARIRTFVIQGLNDMLCQGDGTQLEERLKLMSLQLNVLGFVALEDGDNLIDNTTSFANLDKILDKVNNRLVAASNLPHTKLLGESPSGLGANGNSEKEDYSQFIADLQEDNLRAPLSKLFNYIFLSKKGPTNGIIPEAFDFKFRPIETVNDIDRAKMELDVAKKDEVYIANQVITPEEVALSRYGGKDYSQDTKLTPNHLDMLIEGQEDIHSEDE